MARNINDDVTLAYLFKKTKEKTAEALAAAVEKLEAAIGAINNTIASIQTALNNKVSKSGDTMTGDLTIRKRGPNFDMVNTDADTSAATATAVRYWTAGHFDKNNKYASYWQTEFNTAGRVTTSLGARRIVNGSNVSNSINLVVNADGTFQVGVHSPQAWRTALGVAAYTAGTWTPKLYDYNTYKSDLPTQKYFKIGDLYVMFVQVSPFPETTFATMIQIRNLPCTTCVSGTVYMSRVSGEGGTWAVQGSGTNAYLRPNFAGTITGGIFTAVFLGYD